MVASPEAAKVVLTGHYNDFTKGSGYQRLNLHGLLTTNGPQWRRDRTMLNQCFQYDVLRSLTDLYNKHALEVVEGLTARMAGKAGEVSPIATHMLAAADGRADGRE
jgi:cytochrome P450